MSRPACRRLRSMSAFVHCGGRWAPCRWSRALAVAACLVTVAAVTLPIQVASAAAPLPVSNVEVTGESSTAISFSWTDPGSVGFSGVIIRRAVGYVPPASATSGTAVTTTDAMTTSYQDTGLAPDTRYAYALFAVGTGGATSDPASVVGETGPESVTGLVVGTVTSTSVELSWNNRDLANFTGVTIVRKPGTTPPTSPTDGTVLQSDVSEDTYTDSGLNPGTVYSYAVFAQAVNANHQAVFASPLTVSAQTVPGPVTHVTVAGSTSSSISLSWSDPTPVEDGFDGVLILRTIGTSPPTSPTDPNAVAVANTVDDPTQTTYTDSRLFASTTYSYAIFVQNAVAGYSSAATATAATTAGTLTRVTDLRVTSSESTSVTLAWKDPAGPGLTGVIIRRARGTNPPLSPTSGTFVTDTDPFTTTITDTGLKPGTKYSYAVFAHDNVPDYAAAADVSTATAPGPVTHLKAANETDTQLTLSWTNPTGDAFTGDVIRSATGTTAPTSPTSGKAVARIDATRITLTGLKWSTTYTFAVFPRSGDKTYGAVAIVTAATGPAPDPVTKVSATRITTSTIRLKWTDPIGKGFSGVTIRLASGKTPPSSPTAGTNAASVGTSTKERTVSGLKAGNAYSFALFAHNLTTLHAKADTLTATTTPRAITHLTAKAGAGTVKLSWANPTGNDFSGVVIRRAVGVNAPSTRFDGTNVVITAKGAHSYTDSGLAPGTRYSYALFARSGSSGFSSRKSAGATTEAFAWRSGQIEIPRQTNDGNFGLGLDVVSCPTVSFCMAADDYGSVLAYANNIWSAEDYIDSANQSNGFLDSGGYSHNSITALSCVSPTYCVAGDVSGHFMVYNGAGWSPPQEIDSAPGANYGAGYDGADLDSISCVTTTFCVAVDTVGDELTWNGFSWTQYEPVVYGHENGFTVAIGNNANNGYEYTSVSCASTKFCVATGGGGSVAIFNGLGWLVHAITPGIASVSCSSPTFCLAVTQTGDEETFNGTGWSSARAFDSGNGAQAVSCASSSFCLATDVKGNVLTYNGSDWSTPGTLNSTPPGSLIGDGEYFGYYGMPSVSCPSATFCGAIGGFNDMAFEGGP
jgi:Fibronectin type III domain